MQDVWAYPRPQAVQPGPAEVRIDFGGQTIAATTAAFRVLETSHPPVYYLLRSAFTAGVQKPAQGRSTCEWKGEAVYRTIAAGGQTAERAGSSYPDPSPGFEAIKDHLAVYAGPMDGCFVAGESVSHPSRAGSTADG